MVCVELVDGLLLWVDGDGCWSLVVGCYVGNFVIDWLLYLCCEVGVELDGGGYGSLLILISFGIIVEGCWLCNWGCNLIEFDVVIFVGKVVSGVVICGNDLCGVGFGVWFDVMVGVQVFDNCIEGDESVCFQDCGNGIYFYVVKDVLVCGNWVSYICDGVYIDIFNDSSIEVNCFEELCYGVYYMFIYNSWVIDNLIWCICIGYVLMQSCKLIVIGNCFIDDENYGILMNYIIYLILVGNCVEGVCSGSIGDVMIFGVEGKVLFIYNLLFNCIEGNSFVDSVLGIYFIVGLEDNCIVGNVFIGNCQQVKYVVSCEQEWFVDGCGNYWSDYLGWDCDDDGFGDVVYEFNDNVDWLIWLYLQVCLLLNSLSIELLCWVQCVFLVVCLFGVCDSYLLMWMFVVELRL